MARSDWIKPQPLLHELRRRWKSILAAVAILLVGAVWLVAHWLDTPGAVYHPGLGLDRDSVAYLQLYLSGPARGAGAWLRGLGLETDLELGAVPAEFREWLGDLEGGPRLTAADFEALAPLRAQLVLSLPEPGADRPAIDHAALTLTAHQRWRALNLQSQIQGWFKARAGRALKYRGRYLHGPKSGPYLAVANNSLLLASGELAAYKMVDALLDHRYAARDTDMMLRHTLFTIPGRHALTFALSNREDFLVTLLDSVLDPNARWLPSGLHPLRERLRRLAGAELERSLGRPLGVSAWADWSKRRGWSGTVRVFCPTTEIAAAERETWTGLIAAALDIPDSERAKRLQSWTKLSLLTIRFQTGA